MKLLPNWKFWILAVPGLAAYHLIGKGQTLSPRVIHATS